MAHDHEAHVKELNRWSALHAGHEYLHEALFIFLFIFLIASQVGLYYWKQKSYKTFQNITLFGLWIIPVTISLYFGWWRLVFVWSLFTGTTLYLLKKASQSVLDKETPRQIYAWFYFVWRASYGLAVTGYLLLMSELFGWTRIIAVVWENAHEYIGYFGFLFICYGLYFGVLGRDCAEMCTDRVASKMGYTGKNLPAKGYPERSCVICGEEFEGRFAEVELNCKHRFHEWCIRGWTIIGKKDCCPYCSEKVQLNTLFSNPWQKQGVLWSNLLDSLRYLIVWNPIILISVQLVIYLIDPGA